LSSLSPSTQRGRRAKPSPLRRLHRRQIQLLGWVYSGEQTRVSSGKRLSPRAPRRHQVPRAGAAERPHDAPGPAARGPGCGRPDASARPSAQLDVGPEHLDHAARLWKSGDPCPRCGEPLNVDPEGGSICWG
jgi:hypothetical protein